jgi:tetratricopeptide (TPR) repeat protein
MGTIPLLLGLFLLLSQPFPGEPQAPGAPDLGLAVRQVQMLENANRIEDAYKLYQDLYPYYPEEPFVLNGLRRLSVKLERPNEFISLLETRFKTHPGSRFEYQALGSAYLDAGRKDDAKKAFDKLIALDPKNMESYSVAASAYVQKGLFKEGAEAYLNGRKARGEELFFANELADLYERMKDYSRAVRERLTLLKSDPHSWEWQEGYILKDGEGMDGGAFTRLLEEEARKAPNASDQIYKILGDFQLKQKRHDKALEAYQKVKSLQGERFYLEFGRACENAGAWDPALRAYQTLLQTQPRSSYRSQARLSMARILRSLKRYSEALDLCLLVPKEQAQAREAPQALLLAGDICLVELSQPDKALGYYREVMKTYSWTGESRTASLREMDALLQKGDLGKVKESAGKLLAFKPNEEMTTGTLFRLGESFFYAGDFDTSTVVFAKLAKEHPSSPLVSRALERVIAIGEMKEKDPKALKALSHALLLGVERKDEAALNELRTLLSQITEPELSAQVYLEIGKVYENQGKYPQALEACRSVLNNYPQSRLAPFALERMSEVYAGRMKDSKKAGESLETLILQYPQSLLADGARRRLEELNRVEKE